MAKQKNILLLEDDSSIGMTVSEILADENYHPCWAKNCSEARSWVMQETFDLALLDVSLPDGNGIDFARILKSEQPQCGILFISALSDSSLKIEGLELGAEDYITKPFHIKELLLRVRNALKRNEYYRITSNQPESWIRIGQAEIDFATARVRTKNRTDFLKTKECEILQLLYNRNQAIVSRDEILDFVWKRETYPSPRTVDNFIVSLRKYLEEKPNEPKILMSVRGVGYQLLRI